MKNLKYLIIIFLVFTSSCIGKERALKTENQTINTDSASNDTVLNYILNLPQIQNLSRQIKDRTKNNLGASAMISKYNDTSDQILVGSNMSDKFNTIFIFYRNRNTGDITVSSDDREILLTLEEWKYNYNIENKILNNFDSESFYQLLLNLTSVKDFTATLHQKINNATINIKKTENESNATTISYTIYVHVNNINIPLFIFSLQQSNNKIRVTDLIYENIVLKDWNNIFFDPTYQTDLYNYIDTYGNMQASQLPFDQFDFDSKCLSTEDDSNQNVDYCSKYIRYYFSENPMLKKMLKKKWINYDFNSFFLIYSNLSYSCYLIFFSDKENEYKYMLLITDGFKIISYFKFKDKTLFEIKADQTINTYELKYTSTDVDIEGNEYIEGIYKGSLIEQYKINNIGLLNKMK